MSNRPPDLNQAYRTFQGAHTTEANIMEMLMNTINEIQADNIQLRARVVELEKPVKTEKTKLLRIQKQTDSL